MSNFNIDYIKTCTNGNIGKKSAYIYFLMLFPYFFIVFMNIHEFANYANMITCIFDHKMKGALCLSFNLEQFFVIYG